MSFRSGRTCKTFLLVYFFDWLMSLKVGVKQLMSSLNTGSVLPSEVISAYFITTPEKPCLLLQHNVLLCIGEVLGFWAG